MVAPEAALQQVRRVLLPRATFILEYANKLNIKAMLRYMLRQQKWSPYSLESVEFEKLNFDFHPKAVKTWLVESGFSLQDQLAVSYFRLGVLKKHLPLDLLLKLDAWLQPTGNFFQFSPSVFTRSQATGDTPLAASGTFFRCPICETIDIKPHGFRIICNRCGRDWPIRDGIFDFRLEEK
jgi:hypothetical protein